LWNDAQEFCKMLSKLTSRQYRLPSEAEWEYAARAGSTGDYCFGDDERLLDEYAWYEKNSDSKTHSVGQKKPNDWGLYDVHGNVWEWCEDVWHADYKEAPVDGSAWVSGGDQDWNLLRGGSWIYGAVSARAVFRSISNPVDRREFIGFRVALARSPS
jgi:formylglycine-generating enzyme required for sulfatase activity